jgi:hypothetical protein
MVSEERSRGRHAMLLLLKQAWRALQTAVVRTSVGERERERERDSWPLADVIRFHLLVVVTRGRLLENDWLRLDFQRLLL